MFGTSGIAHSASTHLEVALSHLMQDLYLAFISDPWRGLPAHGWGAFKPDGSAVEFSKNRSLVGKIKSSKLARACNGIVPVPGAIPLPKRRSFFFQTASVRTGCWSMHIKKRFSLDLVECFSRLYFLCTT